MINKGVEALILKAAQQEERISIEIVYEPDVKDAHNQWMSKQTVRSACENFNENLKAKNVSPNLYHIANTNEFEILKSWIAEMDMTSPTGELVREGTWLVKLKYSPALWVEKKAGKFSGVSIGCRGIVDPQTGEITNVSFWPD